MHYYYDYPGMGVDYGVFGLLGGLIRLIFWVFIVVLAVKLIKRGRHGGWHRIWNARALGTLSERFAKGEISKEEYEEKKKVLES